MTQSESTFRLGVGFLWAALVVRVLEVLLSWVQTPFNFPVVLGEVIGLLIGFWLTVRVAADHTWARVVYLVLTILATPLLVTLTAVFVQLPGLAPGNGLVVLVVVWLPLILNILGLILVFGATTSGGKVGLVFVLSVAVVAGVSFLVIPVTMSTLLSDPKSIFSLLKVANKVKQEQRLPAMIDD